jgi:PPOX class probable F420-dependent enzyme
MTMVDALAEAPYVSLTSYRKDGTPVATPLWVVRDGDALAVWTPTDSWKVKRIRRNPQVTVAPCQFRGQLTGDPVPGRAEVMSAEDTQRVRDLLRRKYGLTGRLTLWGSRLRRGLSGTVGIRISPES